MSYELRVTSDKIYRNARFGFFRTQIKQILLINTDFS